jgi:hypothetical protein
LFLIITIFFIFIDKVKEHQNIKMVLNIKEIGLKEKSKMTIFNFYFNKFYNKKWNFIFRNGYGELLLVDQGIYKGEFLDGQM